jgi:predicted RecA/RadA family phage recombinase
MGTPASPYTIVNPAEVSSSSTVQGGNMAGVAVAEYEPEPMDVPEGNSFNNAALLAHGTIVINNDDASSSNPPIQLYQFSIADNDNDKDNAGVLAVAEMQARFAPVGCLGSV